MNELKLDRKIKQDVTRVKKDVNTLMEHGINKVGENVNQSTEDVTAWVNNGVAQLSNEIDKVKGDATKTVARATTTVKKKVGTGLRQYNAKAAEMVKKLPGNVGAKVGKYPWVAISLALTVGFLLRGLLAPRRDYLKSFQPDFTQNMG